MSPERLEYSAIVLVYSKILGHRKEEANKEG
jgi:hypothetical protein